MLRLTSITLRDFGPFKGEQTIRFPSEDGVCVVYGENMRGKTTLLNAIRYAFFGKIIGRGLRQPSLEKMGNWEAAEEGRYGFEVELRMNHLGHKYQLVRTYRPKGGGKPQSEDDYKADFFLERDGSFLSTEEAGREMHAILPEQISRFFLFDGELLQEYEDLLHSDSDMGPKIRGSIERILGIPVLTGARDGLRAAYDRAEKQRALAAQGDQKTRELGTNLSQLHEEREVLERNLATQSQQLAERRARKAGVEEDMRKRERTASLLERRDRLETDVTALNERLAAKKQSLEQAMSGAWNGLIVDRLQTVLTDLRAEQSKLQTSASQLHLVTMLAEGDHSTCPACLQTVSESAKSKIHAELKRLRAAAGDSESRRIIQVGRQIEALEKTIRRADTKAAEVLFRDVEEIQRDLYSKLTEITELSRDLAGGKDDDIRHLRSDWEKLVGEIKALEDGVEKTQTALGDNAANREKIQRRLDQLAGGGLDAVGNRVKLASDLHALFEEAVVVFREKLRNRVQRDATRHFLSLTTEPEYQSLRINDSYGLTIIHQNGSEVPIRSAGAEHVVALSLVSALQNNAPLRGPIIIDSPFGRLDGGHRAKIVQSLPGMASQVLLLAYEEEMPPARARQALDGRLRAEWVLKRISARHTEIAPRKAD